MMILIENLNMSEKREKAMGIFRSSVMPAEKRKIEELENDDVDDVDDNDDHSLLTRRQAKRRKYVICDSSSENEIEREDLDLLSNVTSTPQKRKNANRIKDGLTDQPMDISNISGSISDMDVNSDTDVSSVHSISSPSISDISGMKEDNIENKSAERKWAFNFESCCRSSE